MGLAQELAAERGRRQTCNFRGRVPISCAPRFTRLFGLGLEDSDLVIRMLHAGGATRARGSPRPVSPLAREHDRTQLTENRRRLDEIIASTAWRRASGSIVILRPPAARWRRR